MAQYKIIYNPYSNNTKIEKNGKSLQNNNRLCAGINGKRLQEWFDLNPSWNGFAKELDDNNNDNICKIEFIGREIDFLDLEEYFNDYMKKNKKTTFKLSSECYQNDSDILQQLTELIHDVKEKKLLSEGQIKEIEEKLELLKKDTFAISVLATMSSGKSTLLNALLSANILPVGNRATTANIVEIYDNDGDKFEVETYDKNGMLIAGKREVNTELIKEINNDKSVHTAKIYGNIPFVNVGKMSLMLRDTPGPNSQKEEHGQLTDSIIMDPKNQSAIIYVMDTTKPEDKSDGELLKAIAREMKKGDRLTADRFFFVINKVDDWVEGNDSNDQTMDKLISETRTYLENHGIENPRLFPVTADLALKIRRKIVGDELNPIAEKSFKSKIENFSSEYSEIQFEKFSSASKFVNERLETMLRDANNEYEIALIHSGIVSLELSIREYMEKYAYPIKISDAVKEIIDTIDEEKMKNEFNKAIAEDVVLLNTVKKQIEELKQKKEDRLARRKEYEKRIRDYKIPDEIEIQACQSVENEAQALIDEVRPPLSGSEIEISKAKQICDKFEGKVKLIEQKAERDVNKALEEELYQDAEKALDEFKEYLKQIKNTFDIQSFDFCRIKKLKAYDFSEIESDAKKIARVEYTYKTVKKTKKVEKHFLFFKWKSEVEYEDREKDGIKATYIDCRKLRDDILSIHYIIPLNIKNIITNAEDELESYKDYFINELQNFDEIIEEVVKEIDTHTREESLAMERKDNHEQKLKALNQVVNQICKIIQVEA